MFVPDPQTQCCREKEISGLNDQYKQKLRDMIFGTRFDLREGTMVHDNLQDGMRRTRLQNESKEYLSKREELRQAEIESVKARERVAQLRRELPPGAVVKDYAFIEGPGDLNAGDSPTQTVHLSQLFTAPNRSLVIYQFMYGKRQTSPCPMCTLMIDSLNGVAHHLAQNVDLAIVAAAAPTAWRAHARRQGWQNLRLLSTPEGSTFKYDLGGEDGEGNQDSTLSVFTRDAEGTIRHFYSTHPQLAPDMRERGVDLLSPVYNVLDLTPQGRGDWYASLDYAPNVRVHAVSERGGQRSAPEEKSA
jgi:predicted dithiol-disulfide oxidoreductase (DUF899 family)